MPFDMASRLASTNGGAARGAHVAPQTGERAPFASAI
jgi:hypothetical protein